MTCPAAPPDLRLLAIFCSGGPAWLSLCGGTIWRGAPGLPDSASQASRPRSPRGHVRTFLLASCSTGLPAPSTPCLCLGCGGQRQQKHVFPSEIRETADSVSTLRSLER
ncbi:hypothetical protein EYF80_039862 [Liparis tanakae]|uniref:Uncharacterized protein n=1 Tax=Liparis tanakae TaxID=230148 RepID=A0A4Z2GA36_9TELE|nr:hypothetical protein EYF80_039862 [Liparis tanakae]